MSRRRRERYGSSAQRDVEQKETKNSAFVLLCQHFSLTLLNPVNTFFDSRFTPFGRVSNGTGFVGMPAGA
jgi:hypothetical protein